jgi:hypothetical protein
MNHRQRQVVAEKVGSTVRVLELLGLEYSVAAPRRTRKKGNVSPRVVSVDVGKRLRLRVYNSTSGATWAHEPGGKPIPGLKSVEDLYLYLLDLTTSHRKR